MICEIIISKCSENFIKLAHLIAEKLSFLQTLNFMTWWKLGWYTTLKFLQVCQMIMTYLKKIGSNGLNIDLSKNFFIIIKSLYQNLHFNIKQNFWETLHKLRTASENRSSTLAAPCRLLFILKWLCKTNKRIWSYITAQCRQFLLS